MAIRALIFDFDGLIMDTESAEWASWSRVFAEHGAPLTLEEWLPLIGTYAGFDPVAEIARRSGGAVDAAAIEERQKALFMDEIGGGSMMPGVEALLKEARARPLLVGLASSSTRRWVYDFLALLDIEDRFDAIRCREDVAMVKPAPDLYLATLEALDVPAAEAVALEDSFNGVRAAKAAGLRCVAVPNGMTHTMDLSEADLIVPSLAEVTLEALLQRFV